MAELAVGNAIALLRQTHKANADLHKGIWPAMFRDPRTSKLWHKTVGIVGLSNIRYCWRGCFWRSRRR